jgi:hypothetical protein
MDLVDEEHLTPSEVREKPCKVTRLVEDGSGRCGDPRPHLGSDDIRQGRLPESGGTGQQDVVERFAALPRSGDEDAEIAYDRFLPLEVGERGGAECEIEIGIRIEADG